ncbi:hypothetical protein LOTGIDRAFT_238827 [Lottia gigantea]|uniref:Cadherin domain-containing protein n=1 Tax=Lottia gigantea TaxID=225164 RepID=V4APP9_LOTGI|nr:hypothetical protein LOTGIDRAFT_238827 [Lottia gigantea]ESO99182.1 hypothetical protein LOTGIDRAFT_238827 [Lottia gigantea]
MKSFILCVLLFDLTFSSTTVPANTQAATTDAGSVTSEGTTLAATTTTTTTVPTTEGTKSPEILNQPLDVNLLESTKVQTELLCIDCTDPDGLNTEVHIAAIRPDNTSSSFSSFAIWKEDGATGYCVHFIPGQGMLSYTETPILTLQLECTDGVDEPTSADLTVRLQPNYPPQFTQNVATVNVPSSQSKVKNDVIYSVTASDATPGDNLTFTMTSSPDTGYFTIDPISGEIKANQDLSTLCDVQSTELEVMVTDGFNEPQGPMKMTLNLDDINQPPSLTNMNREILVGEHALADKKDTLYTIEHDDEFILNNQLQYTLVTTPSEYSAYFAMKNDDGYCPGQPSWIKIKVTDENDPVTLNLGEPLGNVDEGLITFDPTPQIKDEDRLDNPVYSLVGKNTQFTIDPSTGVISSIGEYDRDSTTNKAVVNLMIRATDKGGNYSEAAVTLNVDEINDNAPEVTSKSYTADAMTCSPPADLGITLPSPTDDDRRGSINEDVEYIPQSSGPLMVTKAGQVFLTSTPNAGFYSVNVFAKDQGINPGPLISATSVTVNLLVTPCTTTPVPTTKKVVVQQAAASSNSNSNSQNSIQNVATSAPVSADTSFDWTNLWIALGSILGALLLGLLAYLLYKCCCSNGCSSGSRCRCCRRCCDTERVSTPMSQKNKVAPSTPMKEAYTEDEGELYDFWKEHYLEEDIIIEPNRLALPSPVIKMINKKKHVWYIWFILYLGIVPLKCVPNIDNQPLVFTLFEGTIRETEIACITCTPTTPGTPYDLKILSVTPSTPCGQRCFGLWNKANALAPPNYCLYYVHSQSSSLSYLTASTYRINTQCRDDTTTSTAIIEIRLNPNTPPYFTSIFGDGQIRVTKDMKSVCSVSSTELQVTVRDNANTIGGPKRIELNFADVAVAPSVSNIDTVITIVELQAVPVIIRTLAPSVTPVTYNLLAVPTTYTDHFSVQGTDGNDLFLTKALNFEDVAFINVTVEVQDGFCIGRNWIGINVFNQNDPPTLTVNQNAFVVDEGMISIDPGFIAVDEDQGQTMIFSFTAPNGQFSINPLSGVITSLGIIDLDVLNLNTKSYDLNVQVSDGQASVTTNIKVTVREANDNKPIILGPGSYSYNKMDCDGLQKLGTVQAFDSDIGTNGEFEFIGGTTGPLTVTRNGMIFMEANPAIGGHFVEVRAIDHGVNPLTSSAPATVTLIVLACPEPSTTPSLVSTDTTPVFTGETTPYLPIPTDELEFFTNPDNIPWLVLVGLLGLVLLIMVMFVIHRLCCAKQLPPFPRRPPSPPYYQRDPERRQHPREFERSENRNHPREKRQTRRKRDKNMAKRGNRPQGHNRYPPGPNGYPPGPNNQIPNRPPYPDDDARTMSPFKIETDPMNVNFKPSTERKSHEYFQEKNEDVVSRRHINVSPIN